MARKQPPRPRPPIDGQRGELLRGARLLAMRPPIALGGHTFVLTEGWAPGERCVRCHVWLPRWAMAEGMGHHFGLARLCPALLTALGPGPVSTTG